MAGFRQFPGGFRSFLVVVSTAPNMRKNSLVYIELDFALPKLVNNKLPHCYRSMILPARRSNRPEVLCEKGVLRNFVKFTGKHLCQKLYFNKVAGLTPAILLKNILWHKCFRVNFANFLRTLFFTEHLWWLLLYKEHIVQGTLLNGCFQNNKIILRLFQFSIVDSKHVNVSLDSL